MKLFTTRQIAEIDRYTILHEPVSDIDLMERAAGKIARVLHRYLPRYREVVLFAGPGNNGGDALAVARLLAKEGCSCSVFFYDTGKPVTGSPAINLQRLAGQGKAGIFKITAPDDFPELNMEMMVVDGLFGSGLSRPLDGVAAELVQHINRSGCDIFSIDIPSGLMGEDNTGNLPGHIIRAKATFTLQFPKICLLFPENEQYAGKVIVLDIGLHPEAIAATESPFAITDGLRVAAMLPERAVFSHKGSYGHALLVAGSFGKMGAALLASRACLRTGTGLVTTHLPACGYGIQQTYTPEVMCSIDGCEHHFSAAPPTGRYTAVGAGPGLGTHPDTKEAMVRLIESTKIPLVLDADALNILSAIPQWQELLPENTVLTPHPGEFNRLFGETANSWKRIELQREQSVRHKLVIVLKGARSTISFPDGRIFFNPTGNPGMATAGSGDVLTGIILGLLAQGMAPSNAAVTGVYLHGLAGDLAARRHSMPALIASGITGCLGKAFQRIYSQREQDFSYI